jgi:hypothetical protein
LTEGFKEKVGEVERSFSSLLGMRLSKAFKFPEYSDRMFSVKPAGGTELVEDDGFLFRESFLITKKDRLDVFLF